MKKLHISLLLSLFFVAFTFAQESEEEIEETIVEEFSVLVNKSNSYEEYKVIKKESLEEFKKRLAKEINAYEVEIDALSKQISDFQKEVGQLKTNLETTQSDLESTKKEKDSMSLFGTQMSKAGYQTTLFSVIGVLILLLVLTLIKFKANGQATNEAKENLKLVEVELEECKRKALETQQKLGRELQDYKNKLAKQNKS